MKLNKDKKEETLEKKPARVSTSYDCLRENFLKLFRASFVVSIWKEKIFSEQENL